MELVLACSHMLCELTIAGQQHAVALGQNTSANMLPKLPKHVKDLRTEFWSE